jgi:hypothetical protein
MNWIEGRLDQFFTRYLGGHCNLGPITFYGYNAMHWAINIRTSRGWFCFKPVSWAFGKWWDGYVYFSRDATPYSASWGFGYWRGWFRRWQGGWYREGFGR